MGRLNRLTGIAALFALSALMGCHPEELLENPLLDRYCGDLPCDWETEGALRRVSAWHRYEYALSFDADGARITQRLRRDLDCDARVQFVSVARTDPDTELVVELDYGADGTAERELVLATTDAWRRTQRAVSLEPDDRDEAGSDLLALSIVKRGNGRAELAQFSALSDDVCVPLLINVEARWCDDKACVDEASACADAGLCEE